MLPGWCNPPPCPGKTRGEEPALLDRSQPCFSAGRKITCWLRVLPKVELEVEAPFNNTTKAGRMELRSAEKTLLTWRGTACRSRRRHTWGYVVGYVAYHGGEPRSYSA